MNPQFELISEEAREMIESEIRSLTAVLESLRTQKRFSEARLHIESSRARELTSSLVATRRIEDKALMASDEAVAHGLKDKKTIDIKVLDRILKKPYFARLILEEPSESSQRQIEYKIGLIENSECRIVDWRKAPIAKLYYEYKEGDEYSEEILGRERSGRIVLRNQVEIENGVLKSLSCKLGNFVFRDGKWAMRIEGARSREQSVSAEAGYQLPQIASLLSRDQFELIAESAGEAMLIQGIAGSGKTTVALHRLAWLLGQASSFSRAREMEIPYGPIESTRCLVLVLTPSLKSYLSKTLPALGIEEVKVITLGEWLAENGARLCPTLAIQEDTGLQLKRPDDKVPASIDRLKRSMAILKSLEGDVARLPATLSLEERIISILHHPEKIISNDETHLLDTALIREAEQRALRNFRDRVLDPCDDALLVRAHQILSYATRSDNDPELCHHIVADEVQDFGPIDLACILGAVTDPRGLTLVGDVDQKMQTETTFLGWDTLRKHWAFRESIPRFVSLNLSHRSTIQILKLADHVMQRASPTQSAEGRNGRIPIWFHCKSEQEGIEGVIEWLKRATERYPHALSAVICRSAADMKYAFRLLLPTFGSGVQLDQNVFGLHSSGILVTCVPQVKGLEFTNVLLWNPSQRDYPRDHLHRNLLYTAMTRTEENLCLVTWLKPSELLPDLRSPLVRGREGVRESTS